jgi:hypothetical protein
MRACCRTARVQRLHDHFGQLLFGRPGGFILAVLCSLGIVYLIRRSRERRLGGTAATPWR